MNNEKAPGKLIYSTLASVWDGQTQLSGILELWEKAVVFRFSDFKESHLGLTIPLATIEKVEEFLVFDLARNGLRIQNRDGKFDLFVMEDVQSFKLLVMEVLASQA